MNPDFNKEQLGEDGNTFEAYVTEYTHTVDNGYDEPYTTNVQMIINPETGASIVGNSSEGFFLYVPDENGRVHQFAVDQGSGANATIASTQDIRNLAYLVNSDFVNSDKCLGILGTKPVSAYGPNGELVPGGSTPGEMQTMIIGGKEVKVAVTNHESVNSFTSDIDFTKNYNLNESTDLENTSAGQGNTVSGGSSGTPSSYSSMYTAQDYFQKGLNGEAEEYFPWIYMSTADRFIEFLSEGSFSGMMSYIEYRELIDNIIDTANAEMNLIMSDNGEGKVGERANALKEARDLTEDFQRLKESIEYETFKTAIRTYNDNVEQAKVEKTRKALREACQNYNDTNTNVIRSYSTTDSDAARSESNRCNIYSAGVNDAGETVYRVEVYDKIDYDGAWSGIDFGYGLFNMKTDRMVQELEARGVRVSLEDRPAETM